MSVPFFAAAGLSVAAALLSLFFLKETHQKQQRKAPFKFKSLLKIINRPVVGPAVLTGFILTTAQFVMLIGFQTFCTDTLKLSPTQVGIFYAGFGITGILMQLAVPLINKTIKSRSWLLLISTVLCIAAIAVTGLASAILPFAIGVGAYGLFNGLRNPMLNAIIADHAKQEEQGEVMGINQSYTSMGQALGPVIAGLAASVSLHLPFFIAAGLMAVALFMAIRLKRQESPAKA
jgi:predicted MFS family arabinose efflux permease